MFNTVKTAKRIEILERVMATISSPKIFDVILYKKRPEDYIKQYMHQPLVNEVSKLYEKYGKLSEDTAIERTKKNLLWEGDSNTTVSNFVFFGVQHRPDFVLDFEDGMRIAIEVKRGSNGSSIREGFGQSIVYNTQYDFTLFLFVDISDDKRILNSFGGDKEQNLVKKMWENHNTIFKVV